MKTKLILILMLLVGCTEFYEIRDNCHDEIAIDFCEEKRLEFHELVYTDFGWPKGFTCLNDDRQATKYIFTGKEIQKCEDLANK